MSTRADAAFARVFALDLPHGRCVAVSIPETTATNEHQDSLTNVSSRLHALEVTHARGLPPARQPGWIAGRLALRAAVQDLGLAVPDLTGHAILPDERGAPRLPAGLAGSISHKAALAIALAATSGWSLGVDLEATPPTGGDLSRRVLRPSEQARLPPGPETTRRWEVLWAFSAKEAIYKALDPFVRRHVGFHEVEVTRGADGAATAALHLAPAEGPFDVELAWVLRGPWIIATARVRQSEI